MVRQAFEETPKKPPAATPETKAPEKSSGVPVPQATYQGTKGKPEIEELPGMAEMAEIDLGIPDDLSEEEFLHAANEARDKGQWDLFVRLNKKYRAFGRQFKSTPAIFPNAIPTLQGPGKKGEVPTENYDLPEKFDRNEAMRELSKFMTPKQAREKAASLGAKKRKH